MLYADQIGGAIQSVRKAGADEAKAEVIALVRSGIQSACIGQDLTPWERVENRVREKILADIEKL